MPISWVPVNARHCSSSWGFSREHHRPGSCSHGVYVALIYGPAEQVNKQINEKRPEREERETGGLDQEKLGGKGSQFEGESGWLLKGDI